MNLYTLVPNGFGANCYVLVSDNSAAVIDPSVDAGKIVSLLSDKSAKLEYIILTHGHFDHITSLDTLRSLTGAPAYVHKEDNEMLGDGNKNAYSLFFGADMRYRPAEKLLENGDTLQLGSETLTIISTPGHSKGSICILGNDFMITGDTLFENGFGRYDLHGGDPSLLTNSLRELRSYDQDIPIYPGHGGCTCLGQALDNLMYY